MPPCCDLPAKLIKQSTQERDWLNPWQPYFLLVAVLGADKENVSLGAVSGCVLPGVALSVLLKMERVVRSSSLANNKVPLQE